jgi:hypothetical protein
MTVLSTPPIGMRTSASAADQIRRVAMATVASAQTAIAPTEPVR